jgi:crotonobetainyl-CoA:carnitine CoA-transferase CaiB-like acyl-CoA transferase
MQATNSQAATGPLVGIKVVEFGEGTAGPYAAKLFGDFGADVIKIERPSGDPSRLRGPFPNGKPDPEASGLFHYLNTNKRGVTLDVNEPKARNQLNRLLADADIFISNLDSATLSQAHLSPQYLRQAHPNLIVTTISPFGSTGPWSDRKGDELTAFATSGMAYSTPGMPDAARDLDTEPPLHPACFAAETITGLAAATATMAAVLGQALQRNGCHIEISAQAALASMQIRDLTTASYTGQPYNRLLNPMTIGRMPNFYLPCKDGYVTIAAPMEVHWDRLVEAMDKPAWALTERFSTERARTENWIDLRLRLLDWTMTLAGSELHAIGEKYQLPFFPFYSVKQVSESDHVKARGSLTPVEIGGHTARMPGPPVHMRGTPWALRRPAPRLGEHNDQILVRQNEASS